MYHRTGHWTILRHYSTSLLTITVQHPMTRDVTKANWLLKLYDSVVDVQNTDHILSEGGGGILTDNVPLILHSSTFRTRSVLDTSSIAFFDVFILSCLLKITWLWDLVNNAQEFLSHRFRTPNTNEKIDIEVSYKQHIWQIESTDYSDVT